MTAIAATATRPAATSPTAAAGAAGKTHTVRAGDTLWQLAKQHGVSLAELQKANPQVGDARALKIGSELRIPNAAPAAAAAPAAPAATQTRAPASAADQSAARARATAAEQLAQSQVRSAAPALPAMKAEIAKGNFLNRGDKGPAVVELQRALGMPKPQQDGVFGPVTESALKGYQASRGLKVDGIAGPQTLGALQQAAPAAQKPAAQQPAAQAPAAQKPAAPAQTAPAAPASEGVQNPAPRINQHALNHPNAYGFCGVASSLMVLGEAGKSPGLSRSALNEAASRMYIPGQGSSGAGMANYLSEKGLPSRFTMGGTTSELVRALQQGRPVPVGVDSFGGKVVGSDGSPRVGSSYDHKYGPSGHWVTVTGFKGPASNPTSYTVNDPNTGATVELSKASLDRHAATHKGLWMVLPR